MHTRLTLGALLLLACAAPPPPRILGALVAPLPAAVRSAEVMLFSDGEAKVRVEAPLRSELRDGELRLSLPLPEGASGPLRLGVALLDEQGCLIAVGLGQGDADAEGQLWVPPQRIARDCRQGRPLLFSATPGMLPSGAPAQLTISGWGFLPGAQIVIGGKPAPARWRSPLELVAESTLPAAAGPLRLEVANPDHTKDGRDDLLRAYLGAVAIAEPEAYVIGRMSALAVSDLDGDGAPEILLGLPVRGEVAVLKNRGDGTFLADEAPRYPALPGVTALALLDLDGDGTRDLVAASREAQSLHVRKGRPDGTFGDGQSYGVSGMPGALAVADLEGDGRAELLVALPDRDMVRVVRAAAGGLLLDRAVDLLVGRSPGAIAVGDLDGDGAADIVSANGGSADLSVLLNRGDGTFPSWLGARYATGAAARYVELGDVNGDGRLDVLTGGGRGGVALLNGGGGAFPPARRIAFGVTIDAELATAADVNGDGRKDLAMLTTGGGFLSASFLFNNGAGVFHPCCSLDLLAGPGVPFLALSDVDRDGLPDLVVATTSFGGQLVIARSRPR